MSDEQWWLHFYVTFFRATCMRNTLTLRPPSREFLERGKRPKKLMRTCTPTSRGEEEQLAARMGFALPPA
eukprot:3542443-Pyramimonas_sp.AAC.1